MSLLRRRPPNWDETTPDEELVRLTQHGQRDAFGLLYDRYLTGVYGYCFRMLGDQEAAQDANSIVFTKALAGLNGFRSESTAGSFRRWLFAIAHNVIADELRARRGALPLDVAESLVDPAPTPEDNAISIERRTTVLRLLSQLSTDQGHVIAMRLSGLNPTEIAEILGRPRNAIDGIQHRALIRLQEFVATDSQPVVAGGGSHD